MAGFEAFVRKDGLNRLHHGAFCNKMVIIAGAEISYKIGKEAQRTLARRSLYSCIDDDRHLSSTLCAPAARAACPLDESHRGGQGPWCLNINRRY